MGPASGASAGRRMGLFSSCGQRQGAAGEVRVARVIAGLVGSPGTICPKGAGQGGVRSLQQPLLGCREGSSRPVDGT